MRPKRKKSCWGAMGVSTGAVAMVLIVSVALTHESTAWPPYLNEWMEMYPDSTLPQRMEQQFGDSCFVCHSPAGFSVQGNCYREDLRELLWEGYSLLEALETADGMDSDGDGVTNGKQITMAHADLPGEVGYNPGLSGCFGTDECSDYADIPWTGVPESPTVQVVTGDLNCDGVVNVLDLLILLENWGPCPDEPQACIADLSDTGTVNITDLLILLENWG